MLTTLQKAVIEQLGYTSEDYDERNEELVSTLSDVCNYGAGGGFGQFVYYKDTAAFFDDHRARILSMASELACELDTNSIDLITGFNCLGEDYREAVEAVVTGSFETGDDVYVKNALAWFALEEVARQLVGG